MDFLTELRSAGLAMAKRWNKGADGAPVEVGYELAKHFTVREHAVASIHDVAGALDEIARSFTSCVIRGVLKTGVVRHRVMRRRENFIDAPHRWSLHDFDDVACPEWLNWRDEPEAAAGFVRSLLPAEFHEATCHWSFTGGQGFKPGLRMRLAFWHDRPVSGDELKLWLAERTPEPGVPRKLWRKLHPVDASIYASVQPIYTAAPLIAAELVDPVPRRSGMLIGRVDEVLTPAPIVSRYGGRAGASIAAGTRIHGPAVEHAGSGFAYHRDRIGDDRDGFHEPMRAALAAWIQAHGSAADPEKAIQELAATARVFRGARPEAEVESRINDLPRMAVWLRERQRESERARNAVGARCVVDRSVPTLTLGEAERELTAAIDAAFAQMVAYIDRPNEVPCELPVIGIGAGIGLGKTEASLRAVARLVSERPALRVAYAVPTHKTGLDILSRMNAIAGKTIAANWLGTSQPDPSRPGCTMCRVPRLVAKVQNAGGRISDVCGGPKRGWCPHNPRGGALPENACGYRQQAAPSASVWIVPHAMLTAAAPKGMPEAFDLVVIDEAPWLSLFGGLDKLHPVRMPLTALLRRHRFDGIENLETIRYSDAVDALGRGLAGQAGLLKRQPLLDAGLTASAASMCASLAWNTKRTLRVRHDLNEVDAVAALDRQIGSAVPASLLVRTWELIAAFLRSEEATAPWTLQLEENEQGALSLRLRWKQSIAITWRSCPTLYLDATIVPEVVRCWMPDLMVATQVRAREESVVRVQVADQDSSKRRLTAKAGEAAQAAINEQKRLRTLIEWLAFRYRGEGARDGYDVAVVGYKDLAARLRAGVPSNVFVGHFGSLRGFDGLRSVRVIVTVGRPLPGSDDVLIQACLAAGTLLSSPAGYDLASEDAILMRDGSGRRVRTQRHEQPLADAFRRQVLTEVEQAEGRARGVRRTRADPLLSIVLNSQPTTMPVDEVLPHGDVLGQVDVVGQLFARGIVAAKSGDVAAILADEFDGDDPAAAVRQRLSQMGTSGLLDRLTQGSETAGGVSVSLPYISSITVGSQLRTAFFDLPQHALRSFHAYGYRRSLKHRRATMLIDLNRHPDPHSSVASVFGKLMTFAPAPSPAWLAEIHRQHLSREASAMFPPTSSIHEGLLGTDHRNPGASPPVLPVADQVLSMRWRGKPVTLHAFGMEDRLPLLLFQTPEAHWPPHRLNAPLPTPEPSEVAPATPARRSFTIDDIASAAGLSTQQVRQLSAATAVRKRAAKVGRERAIIEGIASRIGPERFSAVTKALTG